MQTGLTVTIWYMRTSGSVFGMGHLYAAVHRPTCKSAEVRPDVISGFLSSKLRAGMGARAD